jgi:ABC-type multidrug transport system fused ATPase/permease subunit
MSNDLNTMSNDLNTRLLKASLIFNIFITILLLLIILYYVIITYYLATTLPQYIMTYVTSISSTFDAISSNISNMATTIQNIETQFATFKKGKS